MSSTIASVQVPVLYCSSYYGHFTLPILLVTTTHSDDTTCVCVCARAFEFDTDRRYSVLLHVLLAVFSFHKSSLGLSQHSDSSGDLVVAINQQQINSNNTA